MAETMPEAIYGSDLAVVPSRPYHPKRPHKKTRAGCMNCKTRKVKCDELRPACRSCRLRKVACVYPSPSSTRASSAPTTSYESDITSFPGVIVRIPRAPSSGLVTNSPIWTKEEFQRRMLWFFTYTTAGSFSVDSGQPGSVSDIMRSVLVEHAFKTPFLMDTLLALASLHAQILGQPVDNQQALDHRTNAFVGYRKAVQEASPATFPALLASSLLVTALCSPEFRDPSQSLYITRWMKIWRGIGTMIDRVSMPGLEHTGMSPLFHRPSLNLDEAEKNIPQKLCHMLRSVKSTDADYRNVRVYYEILKYLGSLYQNLQDGFSPIMNLRIITWFTFLPPDFLILAEEKKPRALIILAHYAVFLKTIQRVWWYHGIGERSLNDILAYLDSDWDSFLEAPKLARDVSNQYDIARILLQGFPSAPFESGRFETNWQQDDTVTLGWVDDVGRSLQFDGEDYVVSSDVPGEKPIWHN